MPALELKYDQSIFEKVVDVQQQLGLTIAYCFRCFPTTGGLTESSIVMITNPTTISHEFFKTVNADVSHHIKKKLAAMDIEVTAMELHNSSLTKTFRVYLTVARAVNLKTLYVAEQIVCQEIEKQFAFRPHAFYWSYRPDPAGTHSEK